MPIASKSAIATYGSCLKIFEIENGKFKETASYNRINDSAETLGRVSWAGDGQWLVGPVEEKNILPVFKYENNKKLTRMRHINEPDITTAACYNCTNKYIAVGSAVGAVKIWNVKDKKVEKSLCIKDREAVRFVEISSDDTYVASCAAYSQKPTIKIHGLTLGRFLNALTLDNPAEISDVRFSSIKKNYLGCCTMEGSVTVWDTYKATPVMEKNETSIGACTGIALSPVNYNLVATVTLSDRLTLYDVRQRKAVVQIPTGARLTTVDILNTEPYIVMGSRDGQILLMDLRTSTIIDQTQAFDESVVSIRAAIDRNTIKATKQFEDAVVNTPDEPIVHVTPLEKSIADVFSPPMLISHLQRSSAAKEISLLDAISPISPGSARRVATQTHSTPNIANYSDSFLNLIMSPAGGSAVASPLHIQPVTSPLNFANGSTLSKIALNGIREEPEEDQNEPLGSKPGSSANTTPTAAPPTPIKQVSTELLPSSMRQVIQEVVQKELSSAKDEILGAIREELRLNKQEISQLIQQNRDIMYKVRDDLATLACAIRLDHVILEINEK